MVDYLIVGAALALAIFILVRRVVHIGRGGGCGCEGGVQTPDGGAAVRAASMRNAIHMCLSCK